MHCVVCFLFVLTVVLRQPSNQKENRQGWNDGGSDGPMRSTCGDNLRFAIDRQKGQPLARRMVTKVASEADVQCLTIMVVER
jgi:hypothetical protein